jgi:hypothetical protein
MNLIKLFILLIFYVHHSIIDSYLPKKCTQVKPQLFYELLLNLVPGKLVSASQQSEHSLYHLVRYCTSCWRGPVYSKICIYRCSHCSRNQRKKMEKSQTPMMTYFLPCGLEHFLTIFPDVAHQMPIDRKTV